MHFLLKILLAFLLLFNVVGCGYKPSAKFSRQITGERISTSVIISGENPENTVLVKDAVDTAILEIFHASLADKNIADTHLYISLSDPSYRAVEYNENGYVIAYRVVVHLHIKRVTGKDVKHYTTSGSYDLEISPNSVITDQQRFVAIKNSASKAIKSFLAQISVEKNKRIKNDNSDNHK